MDATAGIGVDPRDPRPFNVSWPRHSAGQATRSRGARAPWRGAVPGTAPATT
jgi:hypothetical protein